MSRLLHHRIEALEGRQRLARAVSSTDQEARATLAPLLDEYQRTGTVILRRDPDLEPEQQIGVMAEALGIPVASFVWGIA